MLELDFEDVLLEVGDFGPYQRKLIYIFLLPASCFLPWITMSVIFMTSVPEHWCYVPEVALSNLSVEQQRALISPANDASCRMYDFNYTDILMYSNWTMPENVSTKACDQGWQYDNSEYDSTIATQWNLVCNDQHYMSFVLMCFSFGGIFMTPIYGALSDKIGRKIVFFIVVIVTCVTSVTSVLMKNFTAFIVFKTINGGLMPCLFQLPFIIVLEIVAPEKRTRMNGLVNCTWSIGALFVPLFAYLTHGWVSLGLWTSATTVIYLFYWAYLPESPRWLVSQQRYEEAVVIMAHIAKVNGKDQDRKQLLAKLKIIGEKMLHEEKSSGAKNSVLDLLKYPQLRKTFIIVTICWIADKYAYDGLQLNAINLAGNEFINFFLLVLVEAPGYLTCWFILDRLGRRWCTAGGFLLTGMVCLLATIEFPHSGLICSLLGKYLGAAAYMATYQQSSELYPTVVRSLGMGMSSTVSAIVALLIPYIIYFGIYGRYIPFLIIGCLCLVAGVSATFLPESLNENLPQSIQDREAFGLNQKFLSWNRRRISISKERAESLKMKSVEE